MSDDDETIGGRRKLPLPDIGADVEIAKLKQEIRSRNLMIDGLLRWLAVAEEHIQNLEEAKPEVEIAVPMGGPQSQVTGVTGQIKATGGTGGSGPAGTGSGGGGARGG